MQHETNIQNDLVNRARKGDQSARAELYGLYSRAMYNKCIRMTGNPADAEDLLHDAFVYAFEHLYQLKDARAFGGWLGKIVVGECVRFSKKKLKWQDPGHDLWKDKNEEDDWWNAIDMERVHEEIKKLPDGCRQVFVLFTLENYAHKTIAQNLGISESTSKSQYQRARKLLKERLTIKH